MTWKSIFSFLKRKEKPFFVGMDDEDNWIVVVDKPFRKEDK